MIVIAHSDTLVESELQSLHVMWNSVFPVDIEYETVQETELFLAGLSKLRHIKAVESDHMIGWMGVFERHGECWFIILTSTGHQGQGIGSLLMKAAKEDEKELNGWIVLSEKHKLKGGADYRSPAGFYDKQGFVLNEKRSMAARGVESHHILWKKGRNDSQS
jgi:GNAT superfamily N-acetyltransferase